MDEKGVNEATVSRVDLEKFKLIVIEELDKQLIASIALKPEVELASSFRFWRDTVGLRIIQEVWGETLEYISVEYPTTWWEHVKQRFAPKWFKKIWPVRYGCAKLEARALYPKLSFPDEPHNLKGHIREYDNQGARLSSSKSPSQGQQNRKVENE